MKRFNLNWVGLYLTAIFCFSVLISCNSSDEPENNTRRDIPLSTTSRATAEELKNFYPKFTMDAIKAADSHSKEYSNVITSPLSASMLLGMIANGVEDELAGQITRYLGVSNLGDLNTLAGSLLMELPKMDQKTKLNIANSVWYNERYNLSNAFSSSVSKNFKSKLTSIDFAQPSAPDIINKWISDNTGGRIKSYFDSQTINQSIIAILLNSIYFKGEWALPYFDKAVTRIEDFNGFKETTKVEMMGTFVSTSYGTTDNFKACTLKFGNETFSLMLILPVNGVDYKEDFPELTPEEFAALKATMNQKHISIRLPKFSLGANVSLNDVMNIAALADLNKRIHLTMFDPAIENTINLYQESSLSVDEKGAELAAVSSGEIVNTAPSPWDNLNFNRPFYFFITEESTGACLLSGRITDL